MAWVAPWPHGGQRAPPPTGARSGAMGMGCGCDGGWFPVAGDHKFISWETHVFCDLRFLTL